MATLPSSFSLWEVVGAIPGLGAAVLALMGYGALKQKVADMQSELDELKDIKEKVARIDERTKATGAKVQGVETRVGEIVRSVEGVDQKVQRILEHWIPNRPH